MCYRDHSSNDFAMARHPLLATFSKVATIYLQTAILDIEPEGHKAPYEYDGTYGEHVVRCDRIEDCHRYHQDNARAKCERCRPQLEAAEAIELSPVVWQLRFKHKIVPISIPFSVHRSMTQRCPTTSDAR